MNLDGRGIPGVSIVTTEFKDAVEKQSDALAYEPAVLYVPHPIQNRTREELAKIADDVIEPALKMLTSSR